MLLLLAGCQPDTPPQASESMDTKSSPWLSSLVQELEQERSANPPAKIYRYTYKGQEVYYLTGRCCDVPGKLFDAAGKVLCEPDGGFTGRGDGRCPDFVEQRQNETLVWEDKREQK